MSDDKLKAAKDTSDRALASIMAQFYGLRGAVDQLIAGGGEGEEISASVENLYTQVQRLKLEFDGEIRMAELKRRLAKVRNKQ